ncbi:hypothetical protein ACFLTQ_02655 [Chloroflexota bacterium]
MSREHSIANYMAIPVLFLVRSSSNSQIATMEKLGMGEAMMIGFALFLFGGALFLS